MTLMSIRGMRAFRRYLTAVQQMERARKNLEELKLPEDSGPLAALTAAIDALDNWWAATRKDEGGKDK